MTRATRPGRDGRREEHTHRVLMGLLLFNSVSSIGGGIALMTGLIPNSAQVEWVRHTDFASLYFPGVILMAVVGGSAAIAAIAMAKRNEGWQILSIAAGVIMMFWIVGEVASIRGFHSLQIIYFVTGALVVWSTPRSSGPRLVRHSSWRIERHRSRPEGRAPEGSRADDAVQRVGSRSA